MNHHIGPAALFRIRHLFRQNSPQSGFRHPSATEDTLTLNKPWGADHRHQIATFMAPALQQQRHIQNHQAGSAAAATGKKRHRLPANQRMHDGLQPCQCRRILEHPRAKERAVDPPIHHDIGEDSGDRGHGRPATLHQPVNRCVGIMHRQPQTAQHTGGGTFPHPDRTGKTKDDHQRGNTPWVRRKSSNGSSGRPSTVK